MTFGVHSAKMLEAVLGRPDNLAEWEALIDEWTVDPDDQVPFPLNAARREQVRATAQEIALVRAHHLVRRYFQGVDLLALSKTLRSMADLVFEVERHEVLSGIDEDVYLAQVEGNRATARKGRLAAGERASYQPPEDDEQR